MDDKHQCALRALTLCDTTVAVRPDGVSPCYCRALINLAEGDQDTVGSMVRWTRAVEVARAQRDPRYVEKSLRGKDIRRRALDW